MNMKGFTLVETIIYIGLFGLMFTGIFTSVYPILTSTEALTKNIAIENEATFIARKLHYALAQGITSSTTFIATPTEGTASSTLVISSDEDELSRFTVDTSNVFCTPPRVCSVLMYSKNGNTPLPLNNERVDITNFTVAHHPPVDGSPRRIEVSFTANGIPVRPIRYYLHF
jgi:type II secretory pathway pseudopilin PulG